MTTTAQIDATLTVEWTEPNVIPPKCRKPRDVTRQLEVTVHVPSITADQAPVAFVVTEEKYDSGAGDYIPVSHELRTFAGMLWRPLTQSVDGVVRPYPATAEGIIGRAFHRGYRDLPYLRGSTAEQVRAEAQSEVADFLAIDGNLYSKAEEPVYVVKRLGFGRSVHIDIEHVGRHLNRDGHTVDHNVFPADRRADAIAYGKGLINRGESENAGNLDTYLGDIEVTGAFTPGSTFTIAPVIDYTDPWKAYEQERWNGQTGAVAEGFAGFRRALLTIPGAVIDTPDGWGGTTKKVVKSAITSEQWNDYQQYLKYEEELGLR